MNRFPLEKAIKAEMGEDTVVIHKKGPFFKVSSVVDGKTSKVECLPMYYNNCLACCGINCCPAAITKTALNAKALTAAGGPTSDEMER